MVPACSRCSALRDPGLTALEWLSVLGPVGALCALVLSLHLWRAVVFFAPRTVRLSPLEPLGAAGLPEPLLALGRTLLGLGLRPLGQRLETPRLGRPARAYEFVDAAGTVFATLSLGAGLRPRLFLLSRVMRGTEPTLVLTGLGPRPGARRAPGYAPGSFLTFTPERLLAAHLRRLDDAPPVPGHDAALRPELARAWYAGPGRPELRALTLHSVLWSGFAVFMFAAVLWARR